ncbi:serine/threonine-protein kinase [Streptomyces sp. NPDC002138]|uniref:serine/threonine-protein kinase n=1 Tax=Streptomyces sp. NPDC002138 TaxID=3154410 RepID=UPI0033220089
MPGIAVHRLDTDDPQRLGDYRLLWRLASGGMGRIYLARPKGGKRLVAVKTLLAQGPVLRVDRERFAREVELARRVDGSYTARVLDADPDAPRPWMAIQYVPAPSLADLVREHGPLAAWAVPSVAVGVAQALMSLHDVGIVHRDVKPQNILLPLTGPLVIDFGISHAVDRTRTSLTLGTVAFTSPEQARGEASTAASDVFSLGATLFHLAVGRPPYREGVESEMVLLAHVQGGKLDLSGLPAPLAPLIEPCLDPDPRRRPDLATVLATAVAALRRRRLWLPVEWTATITAYEAHGRALDASRGRPGSGTGTRTADSAPPQVPPLTDPGEADARKERERRAAAARRRRAAEARRLAEQEGSGSAEEDGDGDGDGVAERLSDSVAAKIGWVALVAVICILLPIGGKWADRMSAEGRDAPSASTASHRATRTPPAVDPVEPSPTPTRTPPTPTRTPTRTPTSTPEPTPPPTPSATRNSREEAFRAVRAGTCLPWYDTGHPDKWNVNTPPAPVGCDTERAQVRVGSVVPGDCPSGKGRTNWRYGTTNLCLTRVFHVGYCVLAAKGTGDHLTLGMFTAVDCGATRVPVAYDYVMVVTGVYRAPASPSPANCRRGQTDSTFYWMWTLIDDSVMVCLTYDRTS